MKLWVDNREVNIDNQGISLQELAQQLEMALQGVALVVNDAIIPRPLWSETQLNEGDRIALFTVIAGG